MKYLKRLLLIMLCAPLILHAQEQSAINWATGLTWQQVKAKAKKENKYIFVDCYATWCKPCKAMDKNVYTVDSVGDFFNAGFLSVKLQMDQTKNDNAEVKSRYKTAREIERQYRIEAYPSYVFFAPTGEVVSKEIGYKDPASFIQMARDATSPSKQYFVLLRKYKQSKLDHTGTVYLIKMAQLIGDTSDYRQILNSYYAYLHKQKKEKLYTKENIEFIASTLDKSNMVLFDMFYPNGKEVNRVMQNNWYARSVVDQVILKEKVVPFLGLKDIIEMGMSGGPIDTGKNEPDWNALYKTIAKDYKGEYADRNVLYAKQWWYSHQEDFLSEARSFNDVMERYGTDTTSLSEDVKLNAKAWFLFFLNVTDTNELDRALRWMDGVVRRGAKLNSDYSLRWDMYMDTYANLFYKAGRTAEAIKWEELAIETLKKTVEDKGTVESYSKGYGKVLEKMRAGKPTWPIDAK